MPWPPFFVLKKGENNWPGGTSPRRSPESITDSRTRPSSRANAGTTQQSCLTDLAAVAASQKISRTYDERYRELTRKIAGADFITSDYYDDGQINAVGLRRDPALTLTSSMLMDTSFAATILTWTRPLARQAHD